AGFADCDLKDSTGCETNVLTDSYHCGQCGKPCRGLCADGRCLIKLADAPLTATSPRLFLRNDWLVFGSTDVDKVMIDGGAVVVLAADAGVYDLAAADDYVYWSNQGANGARYIRRVPLAGGATIPQFSGSGYTEYITLDAAKVYYTDTNVENLYSTD